MKRIFGSFILAVGILAAPNAMAIHTCGQPLGSCLAHWDPITIPKPKIQKPVEAIKPIQRAVPARPAEQKCFKQSGSGVMIQIPCPR